MAGAARVGSNRPKRLGGLLTRPVISPALGKLRQKEKIKVHLGLHMETLSKILEEYSVIICA